jgi:heme exporter protein B
MNSRTGMLRAAALIIGRDLRLAFRRPSELCNPLVFFLVVTSLFPLSMSPLPSQLRDIAPGVLWVAALLSSLLALEALLKSDAEDGTLEQMLLSGQPVVVLVAAKTLAHWLVGGLPLVILSPLAGLSLGVAPDAMLVTAGGLLMGTLTLSFLGSVGAALTIGVRRSSVLLSLLVLPLAMPLLIFGARATDLAMAGEAVGGPLYLLGAVLVFTATLAPFASAAAVRIGLE